MKRVCVFDETADYYLGYKFDRSVVFYRILRRGWEAVADPQPNIMGQIERILMRLNIDNHRWDVLP